nr:hypothetical protein BaRGS_009647 [Batillaria attramentaria]
MSAHLSGSKNSAKQTGQMGYVTVKEHTSDRLVLSREPNIWSWSVLIVVMGLDDIVGVRVDEEDVRYFGKSHIVVFILNTGMTVGVTESYTFGSSREHYQVAELLRNFLELDNPAQQGQDTDDYLGDGSSSEDSFEQVDPRDLEPDPDSPSAPSPL